MKEITREVKLARGVLIHEGKVLLANDIRPDQGHYFLPGGHVDRREPVKDTLVREWREELGWDISVQRFLGCLEHKWTYNRMSDNALVEVFEINFLFTVQTKATNLLAVPESKESHLRFEWVPLSELESIKLLPKGVMATLLLRVQAHATNSIALGIFGAIKADLVSLQASLL